MRRRTEVRSSQHNLVASRGFKRPVFISIFIKGAALQGSQRVKYVALYSIKRRKHTVWTTFNFKLEVEGTCLRSPNALEKLEASCSRRRLFLVTGLQVVKTPTATALVPHALLGYRDTWHREYVPEVNRGGGARPETCPGASWEV